jgi:uncharacterized protein (TIGR02246 family)
MYRCKSIGFSAYASAAVTVLGLVAWPSATRALECQAVDEAAIKQLFVRWNAALQMPNPDNPNPNAVVNLYAREAVLLPTVEIGPYTNPDDIRKYFVHFLERKPSGVIDEAKRTIRIGCNMAFDAGLYTFTFAACPQPPKPPDPNCPATAKARYTYVYKYYDDGGWLIAHHHSSVEPSEHK